jgi:hypothetical protein
MHRKLLGSDLALKKLPRNNSINVVYGEMHRMGICTVDSYPSPDECVLRSTTITDSHSDLEDKLIESLSSSSSSASLIKGFF